MTISPDESETVAPGTRVDFTVVVTDNDGTRGVEPQPVPVPLFTAPRAERRQLPNLGSTLERQGNLHGRRPPPPPPSICPPAIFVAALSLPPGFTLLQRSTDVRLAPGSTATLRISVASGREASGAETLSVSYRHPADPTLVGTANAIYRVEGGNGYASSISIPKELMITDLSVVEDPVRTAPNGAWTFGRLIADMAGNNDPSVFMSRLLAHWRSTQTVNGFTCPARSAIDTVISGWPKIPGTNRLDQSRSPRRLIAIVNRIDLRDLSRGQAGEVRFVFRVTDNIDF